MTIDFGYVTNAGYSAITGLYEPHHDTFEVDVEIEMTDHVDTVDLAVFQAYFAVKFNDIIVVSK